MSLCDNNFSGPLIGGSALISHIVMMSADALRSVVDRFAFQDVGQAR